MVLLQLLWYYYCISMIMVLLLLYYCNCIIIKVLLLWYDYDYYGIIIV